MISHIQFQLVSVEFVDIESCETSPVDDFPEENFDELVEACEENSYSLMYCPSYPAVDDSAVDKYADIAKYGIVDVKGDDAVGRKIIVVYACKLPPVKECNHSLLLRYALQFYSTTRIEDFIILKIELFKNIFILLYNIYFHLFFMIVQIMKGKILENYGIFTSEHIIFHI